jgi:hypothetical protein
MSELHSTDEIADLGAEALRGYAIAESDLIDAASEVLQAAGPALVAAELRRLADTWGHGRGNPTLNVPPEYVAEQLRKRADELDGSAQ